MALSVKSAKALEMAKHALSMLYATDFFTDEEWVKLDGLVHKGKYVWTSGPAPSNLLDGSPLMMPADDKSRTSVGQFEVSEPLDLNTATKNTHPFQPNTPPEFPAIDGESATTYQDSGLLVDCSGQSGHATQTSSHQFSHQPGQGTHLSTPQRPQASPAPCVVRPVQSLPLTKTTPDPLTKANLSTVSHMKPNLAELAKEFRKKHGREPQTVNEIYQPTNPEHWSAIYIKSLARGSAKTAQSTIAPSVSISNRGNQRKSNRPLLDVPADTILIAQRGFQSPSPLKVSVRPGDNLQYCKYVSGTTHTVINLKTGQRGQVSEDIFKDKDGQLRDALFYVTPIGKGKKSKATRHMSVTSADLRAGVDNIAKQNAAEWNDATDDEVESVITQAQRGDSPSASSLLDLRSDWVEEINTSVGAQNEMQPEMMKAVADGVSQMLEEKFQRLMEERGINLREEPPRKIPIGLSAGLGSFRHAPPGGLGSSRHAAAADGVKIPKTQTCWFWEKKTCRFTDEECLDLHAYSDAMPVLKNGKPTWGDLASYKEATNQAVDDSPGDILDNIKTMTCWFWANGGCDNTAAVCKFVHGSTPAGIASQPHIRMKKWERSKYSSDWKADAADGWNTVAPSKASPDWRDTRLPDATQDADSQKPNIFSVLGNDASDDTIGSQKPGVYKPPHLKASNDSSVAPPSIAEEEEHKEEPPQQQQQPEEEYTSDYW